MILLTLLLIFITPFVWWYYQTRNAHYFKNIPGPTPLPIIGNGNEIGSSPREILMNLFKFVDKYGTFFRLFVGPTIKVVLAQPEGIEFLLSSNKHLTKSNAYVLLSAWFGDGLITSNGAKWKNRRRLLNPCFHISVLDQFNGVFNRNTDILVNRLATIAGKGPSDIFPFINLCSIDVLCETSMGVKINAQQLQNTSYVRSVRGFLDLYAVRVFSMWKQFDIFFKYLSPDYKSYQNYIKIMHDFTEEVVHNKRQEFEKAKLNPALKPKEVDMDSGKPKKPLLEMMLEFENEDRMTDLDLREEIDTFMAAGHDTITTAIGFIVLCLARHQDIQDRVYNEIMEVVGPDDVDVTSEHFNGLKYTEMAIKEGMRIFPPVSWIERRLVEDAMINGHLIPKGTICSLFIFGLHHNESVYPNPKRYDPERFSNENRMTRSAYSYIPFSAGPRNCIGQRIAMMEIKTFLVKMLKKYKILEVAGFEPELALTTTLKSNNGIMVKVEPRQ